MPRRTALVTDDELLAVEGAERRRLIELAEKTDCTRFLAAAAGLRRVGAELDAADLHRITTHRPAVAAHRPPRDDWWDVLLLAALLEECPGARAYTVAGRIARLPGRRTTARRLVGKLHTLPHPTVRAAIYTAVADGARAAGYAEHARAADVEAARDVTTEEAAECRRAALDMLREPGWSKVRRLKTMAARKNM